MRRLLLLFLLLGSLESKGQFGWWNSLHNWDGTTPWTSYLNYAHAYLGPNALPIPEFVNEERNYFKSSTQHSLRNDDAFHNWHNELFWKRGKTRFQLIHQSVEYFQTTDEVRDLRASRGESGRGLVAGDFIINVSTQLYHQNNSWYHLTAHTKTASGPLFDARFTDAPGYAYFISGTHRMYTRIGIRRQEHTLQWDAGFGVYQTFWTSYPQNDGFIGNLKWTLKDRRMEYSAGVRTFTGYFLDGDWPRILDVRVGKKLKSSKIEWYTTAGLNDYPFLFTGLGYQFYLSK